MDFCDQATQQEEMMRERAIEAVRNTKPILTPTGACFNCEALLLDNDTAQSCFFNADCRDDWQKRQAR